MENSIDFFLSFFSSCRLHHGELNIKKRIFTQTFCDSFAQCRVINLSSLSCPGCRVHSLKSLRESKLFQSKTLLVNACSFLPIWFMYRYNIQCVVCIHKQTNIRKHMHTYTCMLPQKHKTRHKRRQTDTQTQK